jgi:outer membrane immunogenic protein
VAHGWCPHAVPPKRFFGDKNMKKILLALAALATVGVASPALGADLGGRYYKQPPAYAAPIYNWTGFYIGGHVGGAFNGSNDFSGLVLSDYSARVLGGLQVGADWQFSPSWVLGLEGQYSWLGNGGLNAAFPGGFVYTSNQRGIGSITGRFGYTWGPGLVYVKGGYAYSDNRDTLTFAGVPVAFILDGNHRNGYTVGAGLEYMFAPNWSAKGEYMYYDFGSTHFVSPGPLVPFGNFRFDEHTFKVGVNYRFSFGSSPVVARY